jgi:hypothetical protein
MQELEILGWRAAKSHRSITSKKQLGSTNLVDLGWKSACCHHSGKQESDCGEEDWEMHFEACSVGNGWIGS